MAAVADSRLGERDRLKETEGARERFSQCLINEKLQGIETLPDLCPCLTPPMSISHTFWQTSCITNFYSTGPSANSSFSGDIILSAFVFGEKKTLCRGWSLTWPSDQLFILHLSFSSLLFVCLICSSLSSQSVFFVQLFFAQSLVIFFPPPCVVPLAKNWTWDMRHECVCSKKMSTHFGVISVGSHPLFKHLIYMLSVPLDG